jgi:uncharacterized membrane protein
MPAISKTGSERRRAVNNEQFDREKNYGAAISIAKALLSKGLITEKEYAKIDTIFIRKYRPIIGGLRAKLP